MRAVASQSKGRYDPLPSWSLDVIYRPQTPGISPRNSGQDVCSFDANLAQHWQLVCRGSYSDNFWLEPKHWWRRGWPINAHELLGLEVTLQDPQKECTLVTLWSDNLVLEHMYEDSDALAPTSPRSLRIHDADSRPQRYTSLSQS